MSLSKFLSMLTTRKLYFPQVFALKQRDPFEGSYPRGNYEFAKRIALDDKFAKSMFGVDDDKALASIRRHFSPDSRRSSAERFSRIFYVSCWHISDHENAGLWSQYASEDEGVAVRSTVGQLREALEAANEQIYLGSVCYSDYQSAAVTINEGNILLPIFSKSLSFAHENELRACYFPTPADGESGFDGPPGKLVDCDLDTLISEVYVAPFSPSWFFDTVRAAAGKFDCNFSVKPSSIINDTFK